MTQKLLVLGLVLAACLEFSQGKPSPRAKTMEDYVEALLQGKQTKASRMEEALLQAPGYKTMEDLAEALVQGMHIIMPSLVCQSETVLSKHCNFLVNGLKL